MSVHGSAQSPVWRSLAAALARRGYALATTTEAPPDGREVARVRLDEDHAVVVLWRGLAPKPAAEHELIAELVRDILGASTSSAENTPPPLPTVEDGLTAGVFHDLVGRSEVMAELYRLIDRIAASATASVLIQGENGTGKELVARAIYARSPRRGHRFVATNCSAFNDNLLDSELFGHKRGAFTGAASDKPGLFELADKGTFFLDEIGDMSPALQAKVLRLLQDGTYYRVGDTEARSADVRVLAATNRDLAAMVRRGEFREDLYYRVNVIHLTVPPLRDRGDDLPLLISRMLARQTHGDKRSLSAGCLHRMQAYSWPGNVRELENEIERLVVLAGDDPTIHTEMLTPRIRDAAPRAAPANPDSLPQAIEALEREMIAAALQRHRGNKSRSAQALGVSRRNLIRLVQKYGLGDEE